MSDNTATTGDSLHVQKTTVTDDNVPEVYGEAAHQHSSQFERQPMPLLTTPISLFVPLLMLKPRLASTIDNRSGSHRVLKTESRVLLPLLLLAVG